ncbi:glycosyltransferase family 25 protein [Larkinella insperata]|uniref:Glycosyltransferase family 25 protein n=1 Tax=Larkinella insperata TaxID=332158 RepID=A0ABW3Q076_9BACT|nr:glycosyltransferase family 25 protein [Larkinella insperata]
MIAPVALFAYKRPVELKKTLAALQANHLASESELYVFVDGPRAKKDVLKVEQVRQIVQEITGFKKVHRVISDHNIGCADSIIKGVSQVLQDHPTVIVVEDDIVTTPNFLDFINQALDQYAGDERVFSIGGYTFPFKKPEGYQADGYFFGRHCAWGWGIWADRWKQIDWEIRDFKPFMSDAAQKRAFNRAGKDMVRMLRKTMDGELDAWDIRVCYNIFKMGKQTLYPTVSKVENIGFYSADGMNTNVYNRYKTVMDTGLQRKFSFANQVSEEELFAQQFRRKYSLRVRIFAKLLTYAGMR